MRCSTSCWDKAARGLPVGAVVAATLLVGRLAVSPSAAPATPSMKTVAVFPVENLTGDIVPSDVVRQHLIEGLTAQGVDVLGSARLDAFMSQHRVRYAAGIDTATAEALRKETGVDGIVIPSMELSSASAPPKVALVARLVSITASPTVVWADDVGMAGDDAPGFFELGMVNDYQTLLARALDRLTNSLLKYLETGEVGTAPKSARKFRPKSAYRAADIETDKPYSVAVVPFINLSERRNAGEILASLFMRHLCGIRLFQVPDTGVVRRQLLDARIIMDSGLSVSDAETVAALIEADFVLGGRVTRYDDYEGAGARPKVEFSTLVVERKSRRVVWSSDSYNDGADGVRFFERGTSRTAHAMATQMVKLTTEMIAGRQR